MLENSIGQLIWLIGMLPIQLSPGEFGNEVEIFLQANGDKRKTNFNNFRS